MTCRRKSASYSKPTGNLKKNNNKLKENELNLTRDGYVLPQSRRWKREAKVGRKIAKGRTICSLKRWTL